MNAATLLVCTVWLRFAVVLALGASGLLAQGGGLRGQTVVVQGGTIDVEVGTNHPTVEVHIVGTRWEASYPVPPSRKASLPVPNVPPGTILFVSVGRGLRARVILVEVIAP